MKISVIIPQFLADADVSGTTKLCYVAALQRYFRWAQTRKLNLDDISKADIINYKHYLESSPLKPKSTRTYYSVIRSFYRWAEENNIHDNVTLGIRPPKVDEGYSRMPLTIYQVNDLLGSIDKTTEVGMRDFTLITLMLRNGLRRSEAVNVNIQDIKSENGQHGIYIKGKGYKDKSTFITLKDKTIEAIHDYLLIRNVFDDQDPLFTSTHGVSKGKRLSLMGVSKIVKQRLIAIGLTSHQYTCHSLRHTGATLLIQEGATIVEVQRFLRHKSMTTTQLYTRLIDEQKRLENRPGDILNNLF